jgi:hypothetical protein
MHASSEIHERLAKDVPNDCIFGAVKKKLGMSTVEWEAITA